MNDVGPEHFRTGGGAFCVRLMANYGSEGVWNADGEEALVDDLPIDPGLAARIQDWQEAFDALEDQAVGQAELRAAWSELAEEGLAIARALKQALPDWTVLYLDPALALETSGGATASEISG